MPLKEHLIDASERYLDERCENWQQWGFDNLLSCVIDVRELESVPGAKVRRVAELITILTEERNKMDRAADYARKLAAGTPNN